MRFKKKILESNFLSKNFRNEFSKKKFWKQDFKGKFRERNLQRKKFWKRISIGKSSLNWFSKEKSCESGFPKKNILETNFKWK